MNFELEFIIKKIYYKILHHTHLNKERFMNLLIKRITVIVLFAGINFIFQLNAQEKEAAIGISAPKNNSALISYDIPGDLKPGEEYIVIITMLNNGKTKWKKADNYQLALFDYSGKKYSQPDIWGIINVPLPYDVNPNEKVTFLFKITAPGKTGQYYFRSIMKNDSNYFGEYSEELINVQESGDSFLDNYKFNSQFVTLSVPGNMTAGEKYKVTVIMKNTGNNPWYSDAGNEYKLAPVTESSSALYPDWNSSSVNLSNTVDTGQTATLEFDITAPKIAGKYSIQWMLKKGDYFFGHKTNKVFVNVSKNNNQVNELRANNSAFIEQDIPNSMLVNEDHNVSVTMKNTGKTTWIKGKEQLVMVDTEKKLTTLNSWGVGYIQLPNDVEPGMTVTFKFKVRPREAGWQFFQMMMMNDEGIFGAATQSVEIIVSGK